MASQFPPKKNTAFTLYFTLYKNDGTVIANPGTITKKVSIDGGAIADIAAAVTEEDTTYGQCSLVIAAGEMNGDAIWLYIKDDTTGCVPFTCTLYTTANTQDEIGANVANIHDTDLPAVKTVVENIQAKTDNLPASPAAVGSEMALTAAYDAVKTAASQSSVNAIPTAPLLAANYTAPDNSTIGTINTAIANATYGLAALRALSAATKAVTDKLNNMIEVVP